MVEAATRCLCGRSAPARAALLAAALLVPAEARAGDATELRWTAAAPDRMVQQSLDAARRSPEQAAARLVLAACLHEQAAAGAARTGLAALGAASPSAEIADQARWLGRMLTPESEARPWPGLDRASLEQPPEPRDGMVRTYAILGPFEDAGGGLDRREGPERPEHRYVGADYSWGAYAVRTRRTLPESATARGLPLALYVHPRQESCTYLSSAVWLPQPQAARTALVHVAASGSFRLIWDGALLARGDEAHRGFMLDRARVQLEVEPGEHLLTVKMCSGASADDGRLRVRFTDEGLAPLDVRTSSSPERLDLVAERVRRRPPGARVLRAPTLLERALDLGPAATADQALGAALLRTLGGADDVQSPRAPGLLDRVVAAGTTPADALALAGYLSPSASNRSGWLGQALERALAQGDGETAGFAQRALVRARLEARLSDLARFSAEQPPLRDATDPQARLIKALARAALEGSGLRRAVLGELSALARELGPAAPGAVHEAIAELAEHAHAGIFLGAMRRLGALLPERRDARYLRALRPWGAAVLESAAARLLARQTSADQIVALGELLLDAGRYRAARDAFALATSVAPNRADGFALLGRAALRLAASKQDTERGLAALERARELDPGRAELAAELGLRRGEDEGGKKEARGAIDADAARYLVPAEVFLARARAAPATGEIFERELHWLRAVRYHPDKRVSQLMHYAREIVIEPRT
ncbi:MAG: hypothetical protein HY744_30900, partial [Deltaproteobacteria bacterium]|nr:hypothetical protein [Deltaproteobacteria bacterium]